MTPQQLRAYRSGHQRRVAVVKALHALPLQRDDAEVAIKNAIRLLDAYLNGHLDQFDMRVYDAANLLRQHLRRAV